MDFCNPAIRNRHNRKEFCALLACVEMTIAFGQVNTYLWQEPPLSFKSARQAAYAAVRTTCARDWHACQKGHYYLSCHHDLSREITAALLKMRDEMFAGDIVAVKKEKGVVAFKPVPRTFDEAIQAAYDYYRSIPGTPLPPPSTIPAPSSVLPPRPMPWTASSLPPITELPFMRPRPQKARCILCNTRVARWTICNCRPGMCNACYLKRIHMYAERWTKCVSCGNFIRWPKER
jgi:hypothetical protein